MLQAEYQTIKCGRETRAETGAFAEAALKPRYEVKKSISVSADAFVVATENKDGVTAARAQVAFSFAYLSEDGFKKAECVTEVRGELPIENAFVTVRADNARVTRVGDDYSAKCSVTFIGEGSSTDEYAAVVGGNGLIVKETVLSADESAGVAADEFTVTDEFEIPYFVSEILSRSQCVRVKSVESGVSRIIVSGEVVTELKTLSADGDEFTSERRVTAFRCEAACVGALPDMKARGGAVVKRANYKAYSDETKNRSSVSAEIVLSVYGEAISEREIPLVTDAYSLTDEITLTREEFAVEKFDEEIYKEDRVVFASSVAAPDGARIIGALGERLTVFNVEKTENGIAINGSVRADVAFRNADNGVSCEQVEAPFSTEINDCKDARVTSVVLCGLNARIRNGAIELEYSAGVRYRRYTVEKTERVSRAESVGERKKNECAISVYIPQRGDESWDIAKRLGLTESEIAALNPDLNFPLGGDERILVYRKKTV